MQNDRLKFKDEFKRRTYQFALEVIELIDTLSKGQASKVMSDQLLRSATSIGANVVEAEAASSKKDYTNFFSYALKSANETKFWLGLLRDSSRVKKDEANELLKEIKEIANILAASILTLKGRK